MSYLFYEKTKDPFQTTSDLLSRADPFRTLDRNTVIILKPNLVVSKPSSSGATTDPRIAEAVIICLKNSGFKNISIQEGSWIGDDTKKAFKICGYADISRKYNVPLYDLKDDAVIEKEFNNFKIKICKSVYECGYLINLPLIKGHCQTKITCALKNLKGCIPDSEKKRFHSEGLHKPIACLNGILKQNLIIADGFITDPDFEEGGNPVQMGIVAISDDPVMMDSFAAYKLGYIPEEIQYLKLAEEYGFGKFYTEEKYFFKKPEGSAVMSDIAGKFKIHEKNACSNCYANLVSALNRLKNENEKIEKEIFIGQSYQNEIFDGIGIGKCCGGMSESIPGCPPEAEDIYVMLKNRR